MIAVQSSDAVIKIEYSLAQLLNKYRDVFCKILLFAVSLGFRLNVKENEGVTRMSTREDPLSYCHADLLLG